MSDVVFLHGLNNDPLVWERTAAALLPRLTARALDLPAQSDLDSLAEHVADQLTPGTLLVGHSFGGAVAMAVADRFPELLSGLVLVNAPHDTDSAEQAEQRRARAAAVTPENYESVAMGRLDLIYTPERAEDEGVIAERQRSVRAYGAERYRAHSTALSHRPDRSNFLSETELPVCVIAAEHDGVIPTADQRHWAEQGGATYVEIADTAHMLPAEEPQLLADAINEWWRVTEAGRGYVPASLPAGPLPDYEVHGSGETTLFLLHGAYGDRGYFDDAISRWTRAGLRVVAWTCPGYAPTDEVPQGYGVPLLAEYAARMVLRERTTRNVLLGHSMGALIGPRVPALVGNALDGLILSAGSPGFVNRSAADKEKYLAERVKPITEDGLSVAEYAVGLLHTMMAPGASGPLVDRVIEVVTAMKTESFVASMRAITEYNSVPSLQSLQIPTLMLAGEHDPACTPTGMQRMHDLAPGSEYHEIRGAGHYAFAERPEEYHDLTTKFIAKVDSPVMTP